MPDGERFITVLRTYIDTPGDHTKLFFSDAELILGLRILLDLNDAEAGVCRFESI